MSPTDILHLLELNIRDCAVFMLDPTGHVIGWNAGAERIKGYSEQEIRGRHFSVFYPPQDVAFGKPERELQIAAAQGRVEDEGWRMRKDGTRFWANVVITALYDESGTLRGFGKVTRDLTERRESEQALRESEERFRLLVQDVSDYAIFMLDPTGHVASWNAGAERIKGYSEQEIHGRHFSVFYPPEDIAAGRPERNLETALLEGRVEDEGWRMRKDGTRFWANVVITALYDERRRLRGFGKVTRDLTEWRETERDLRERRRLLSHLVQAQEAERHRIASDVAAGTIEPLTRLAAGHQRLAQQADGPEAARLHELGAIADEALGQARALVGRLRPPGIDRRGLREALGEYLAETAGEWGLKYTFDYRLDFEPPAASSVTVFRICQEALTNVHKHARAGAVTVSLASAGSGVLGRVSDDGIGIEEPRDLRPSAGRFGVLEMRERAETVGGWWTMGRQSEGGTLVQFWIPAGAPPSPQDDPAAP
ncbi:PAS domain-containing sensor histidine kinase [Actinocrinis puniceicyclus]|uniref:PAS domain-containing sensor histidine kinase n=1 Tax=Actinocrinis puniceicyclus TaxID=977794 RepID=UPI003F68A181